MAEGGGRHLRSGARAVTACGSRCERAALQQRRSRSRCFIEVATDEEPSPRWSSSTGGSCVLRETSPRRPELSTTSPRRCRSPPGRLHLRSPSRAWRCCLSASMIAPAPSPCAGTPHRS